MKSIQCLKETKKRLFTLHLSLNRIFEKKRGYKINPIQESGRSNRIFWLKIFHYTTYSFKQYLDGVIKELDFYKILEKYSKYNMGRYPNVSAKKSIIVSIILDENLEDKRILFSPKIRCYISDFKSKNKDFIFTICKNTNIVYIAKIIGLIVSISSFISANNKFYPYGNPEQHFKNAFDILTDNHYDNIMDEIIRTSVKTFDFKQYSENLFTFLFHSFISYL